MAKDYYLEQPADKKGNIIMTCPIKDHYGMMRGLIDKHNPEPMNEMAGEALKDPKYKEGMIEYHKGMAKATDDIWRKEYLGKQQVIKEMAESM